jgi:hypothetical protein
MSYAPYEQSTTRPTPNTRQAAREKRTLGEDAVPSPGHSTANLPNDYRQINGWGVDLDPANRPSFPKELPSTVMTARGDVKHWQEPRTKIHVSNEQPGITPVFGESCPPHGLSGLLRDYAYQYGEATNRHWMTLMLADRVDIFESAVSDVLRGEYAQNKGWSAYAKYGNSHRRRYITLGVAALGAVALGLVLTSAMNRD